jgi:hypothetical protein
MTDNISLSQVKSWISTNKNNFKFKKRVEYVETDTVVKENGWQSQSVEPATPLSCILYLTDSLYNHVPMSGRPGILRSTCTDLESSFTTLLKGRQFPVRRTAEAIIAASTGGPDACSTLGWNALCRLYEIQIVWFDEGTKLIQFYPNAVDEWSSETPIHFMSCLANQVWVPPSSWKQKNLGLWLANKENEGWRVKYNEADGTMEELRAIASKINYQLSTKVIKAELQKQLGKARAIHALQNF